MREFFERRCVVLNKTQPNGEHSSSNVQRDESPAVTETLPMEAVRTANAATNRDTPVVEAEVDPREQRARTVPSNLPGRVARVSRQAENWLIPNQQPDADNHDSRILLLVIKLLIIMGITFIGQVMTSMGWLRAEFSPLNPGVLTLLFCVPLALLMLRVHQQLWGETGFGQNRLNIQTIATISILSLIMIFMLPITQMIDGLLGPPSKNELSTRSLFWGIHGTSQFSVMALPLPVHVFIWAIVGLALGGYIARMLTKSDFVAGDRRVIRKTNACLCSVGLLAGAVSGFLLFFVWSIAPSKPSTLEAVLISCTWALLGGCIVPQMEAKPEKEQSLDPSRQIIWRNVATIGFLKWFWQRAWPHTSEQSVQYLWFIIAIFSPLYIFTMQAVRVHAEVAMWGHAM